MRPAESNHLIFQNPDSLDLHTLMTFQVEQSF